MSQKFNKKDILNFMMNNAIYIVLFVLMAAIVIIEPRFISLKNFSNILAQASTRVIFALGVGTIIVAKGTDLSLGRQVGLAAVISASMLQAPEYAYRMYPDLPILPLIVPIVIVMVITGLFSLINGFVIAKFKVDPFIATLGMMVIVYGVNSIYYDRPPYGAQPIGGLDDRFAHLAQGYIQVGTSNISHTVLYAIAAIVLLVVLWNRIKLGNRGFTISGFVIPHLPFYIIAAISLILSIGNKVKTGEDFLTAGTFVIPHIVLYVIAGITLLLVLWNKIKLGKHGFAINGFVIPHLPFYVISALSLIFAVGNKIKTGNDFIRIGGFIIPYLVLYAIVVIAFMWVIWNKTKFGKNVFAIGGNAEAAAVSGVDVAKMIMLVYLIAGLLYGLGGSLEAARIGTATNNTGNGYELDAISACIVGGLSFSGGIGSIAGIVTGVLIFQVIAYGLSFISVNPYLQFIIKGLIIVIAVAIDNRKYINRK